MIDHSPSRKASCNGSEHLDLTYRVFRLSHRPATGV